MAHTPPLVTIIIPTYNQSGSLGATIESALAQDYTNKEIIIADDKSTDNTRETAELYTQKDKCINYFCNPVNLGRVGNYRKALYAYAKGDYVLNLDGDDQLTDHRFVRKGIELLTQSPNAYLVVGCKQFSYHDKTIKVFHRVKSETAGITGLEFILDLFRKYKFSHLTTIYNRHEALKTDFYRENIISTDIESLLRLAIKGQVIIYNKIVGQWNYTGNNESTNQDFTEAINNLRWIDRVYSVLVNQTTKTNARFWRFRMKVIYSTPFIRYIYRAKRISPGQLALLWKNKLLMPLLFGCFRLMRRKFSGPNGQ